MRGVQAGALRRAASSQRREIVGEVPCGARARVPRDLAGGSGVILRARYAAGQRSGEKSAQTQVVPRERAKISFPASSRRSGLPVLIARAPGRKRGREVRPPAFRKPLEDASAPLALDLDHHPEEHPGARIRRSRRRDDVLRDKCPSRAPSQRRESSATAPYIAARQRIRWLRIPYERPEGWNWASAVVAVSVSRTCAGAGVELAREPHQRKELGCHRYAGRARFGALDAPGERGGPDGKSTKGAVRARTTNRSIRGNCTRPHKQGEYLRAERDSNT